MTGLAKLSINRCEIRDYYGRDNVGLAGLKKKI
jgi:hypothetical protein